MVCFSGPRIFRPSTPLIKSEQSGKWEIIQMTCQHNVGGIVYTLSNTLCGVGAMNITFLDLYGPVPYSLSAPASQENERRGRDVISTVLYSTHI